MGRKIKPDPYLVDEDTPLLTDEQIKELRPSREVFAELGIPMPTPGGPHNVRISAKDGAVELRVYHVYKRRK
ncbi:MAG TPA: hypothetical protein VGD86_09430 [Devosia sp.]